MPGSFPRFAEGNVEIELCQGEGTFLLHGHILALHSSWFEASPSERWSGAPTGDFVEGGKHHCAYQLRFDKGTAFGMLLPTNAITEDTEPYDGKSVYHVSEDDAANLVYLQRRMVAEGHKNMLKLMYHVPVTCDYGSPGAGPLIKKYVKDSDAFLRALHEVGRAYGCEHIVLRQIHETLALDCTTVLDDCLRKPAKMLEVATTYQSGWIFKEAGAHLIGRSDAAWEKAQDQPHHLGIRELFDEKRKKFKLTLNQVDVDLLTSVDVDMKSHKSVDQRIAEMELAYAFFRKWLSDCIHKDARQGSRLGSGYAEVYHRIDQGRQLEETPHAVKSYLLNLYGDIPGYTPSTATLAELEKKVAFVFTHAKGKISYILEAKTAAEYKGKVLHRALTFVEIEDKELPWLEASDDDSVMEE